MPAGLDQTYLSTRPTKALARLVAYALFEGRALGTRGRWVNPLVFALFALLRRLPQLRPVRKPIFIVGIGRSGTTALGLVLSIHREVGFLNEPKALWHAVHPGEDVVGDYSRGPASYRLEAADATPERSTVAHCLCGAALAATGSTRLVAKYPELVFRGPFVRAIFPDARFVLLVRDGRDTCRSIVAMSERVAARVGQARVDWWGIDDRKWRLLVEEVVRADRQLGRLAGEIAAFPPGLARAAVEWIVCMREGLHLREALPGDVLTLRFEDLTARPRVALRELLDFCELPPDARCLAYGETVLSPPRGHEDIELPPSIRPAFDDVMRAFGYA